MATAVLEEPLTQVADLRPAQIKDVQPDQPGLSGQVIATIIREDTEKVEGVAFDHPMATRALRQTLLVLAFIAKHRPGEWVVLPYPIDMVVHTLLLYPKLWQLLGKWYGGTFDHEPGDHSTSGAEGLWLVRAMETAGLPLDRDLCSGHGSPIRFDPNPVAPLAA